MVSCGDWLPSPHTQAEQRPKILQGTVWLPWAATKMPGRLEQSEWEGAGRMWSSNPTSGSRSKGNRTIISKRYLYFHVHCSITHHSWSAETTWVPISGWVDKLWGQRLCRIYLCTHSACHSACYTVPWTAFVTLLPRMWLSLWLYTLSCNVLFVSSPSCNSVIIQGQMQFYYLLLSLNMYAWQSRNS